jgi:hypothetical protein
VSVVDAKEPASWKRILGGARDETLFAVAKG